RSRLRSPSPAPAPPQHAIMHDLLCGPTRIRRPITILRQARPGLRLASLVSAPIRRSSRPAPLVRRIRQAAAASTAEGSQLRSKTGAPKRELTALLAVGAPAGRARPAE